MRNVLANTLMGQIPNINPLSEHLLFLRLFNSEAGGT
jgi:hypothetical protein